MTANSLNGAGAGQRDERMTAGDSQQTVETRA